MKALKQFLPTIQGWVTRKALEVAGYSGIALSAYYKAKEVQLVEILNAQGLPPDQIADLVHKSGNLVDSTAALIPAVFVVGVTFILSRISAKLEEK